ncbi:hypothetical protein EDD29_3756 [Actinocorallia herbida]|uniref:Uncharacterized protein n=1 Tax=Actinocorallia herbida TaxID=58109 RepID=A0A3N1CY20_9ACTN|nr:hypothetical protein [Actinocorallia herbida]ROO86193.1 hypothetical protein EDD29_3756 [Actinocorallia herbida]
MILHGGYDEPSDSLSAIKYSLELKETVTTLAATGPVPDRYAGNVPAVRPPGGNYVVGHGVVGFFADQPWPDRFAAELVARGLRGGDTLTVVGCHTGEPDGFAAQLATELGILGVLGVVIRAPSGYVHWTSTGPILVDVYPARNEAMRKASRAYSKAEDTAWADYVAYLKAASVKAATAALPSSAAKVYDRLKVFADTRPKDNADELNRCVAVGRAAGKAGAAQITAAMKAAVYVPVLKGPKDKPAIDRTRTYERYSADLRALLTDFYHLADANGGRARAAQKIDKARAKLRAPLELAWPAYSAGYLDQIRAAVAPAHAGRWIDRTSMYAAPPVLLPIPGEADAPEDGTLLTGAAFDAAFDAILATLDF